MDEYGLVQHMVPLELGKQKAYLQNNMLSGVIKDTIAGTRGAGPMGVEFDGSASNELQGVC